jgi:iron-sulfur cluster repair protein YtfE (RIC family)
MTTNTETVANAWKRRDAAHGRVDFVMMYAAHDAFNRDLTRLADAVRGNRADTPAAAGTWEMFTRQLHVHHTTEDTSLWPPVRAAITQPRDAAVLDAMESEHAALDQLIESVGDALRRRDRNALGARLEQLAAGLAAHTRHEEDEALPIVDRRIGQAGWDRFGKDIRRVQGISGAAVYLPWVLDGAPDHVGRAVLGILPPPVRVIYRRLWEPRYRKAEHL